MNVGINAGLTCRVHDQRHAKRACSIAQHMALASSWQEASHANTRQRINCTPFFAAPPSAPERSLDDLDSFPDSGASAGWSGTARPPAPALRETDMIRLRDPDLARCGTLSFGTPPCLCISHPIAWNAASHLRNSDLSRVYLTSGVRREEHKKTQGRCS